MNQTNHQKGIAVLIVVACLTTLSILAVTLVRLSVFNRATSQNFSLSVEAKLIAYVGIEKTIALLQQNTTPFTEFAPSSENDWLFKDFDQDTAPIDGIDDNNSDVGAGRSLDNAVSTASDSDRCTPSFAVRNPNGTLQTFNDHYFSGFGQQSNFNYALKILDTSSQIHLNSPKFKCVHMLTTLFLEIFGLASVPENAATWQQMSERILDHRDTLPGQIFTKKNEISGENRLTTSEYEKVEDFICIHSWENPHTWAPPTSSFYDANKPNYVEIANINTLGFKEQPRAPININTAAKPVLIAVLANLSGLERVHTTPGSDPYKKLQITKQAVSLSHTLAQQIATEIVLHRIDKPFKLWSADCPISQQDFSFNLFIDNLSIPELTQSHKNLIKTNANPNAIMNRFLPNKERYIPVDKSDIIEPTISDPLNGATTEFCFTPTGIYEITCLGRVFHPITNKKITQTQVKAVVQIANPSHHTRQRDFFAPITQTGITLFPETVYHSNNGNLLNENSNNIVQNGSTIDGYIQLENSVEFPTSRIFKVLFDQQNFNDLWHAEVAGDVAPSIQEKYPIFDENSGNTEKLRSVLKGEFRTPEGALCVNHGTLTTEVSPNGGQMIAFPNSSLAVSPKEGTISLWIKFENIEVGADECILHVSHHVDVGIIKVGIEMDVSRYVNISSNRNELHISRWVWEEPLDILSLVNFESSDIPVKLWTKIVISDIDIDRQAKKWYRLVIGWEDYTQVHAVFTHDGVNSNTDALFHFTDSLANTIPNNGIDTIHLERIASSDLDKNSNDISGISSYLAIGGYSFTPTVDASLFNQGDITFTDGVPSFRFANSLISRVEGYSSCLITADGSDFYETPYLDDSLANPGGTFEQNILLDCGCGGSCSNPLTVSTAQFTIWNSGDLSGAEFNNENISATTGLLANNVIAQCGDVLPYTIFLTSDDGETTPIFDDVTVFSILCYPKFLEIE